MMFRTHLIFAFMVAILILPFINTKERIVFIMLICFFGIFPDIDTHNSKIANKIWPLNYLLNFLFGHRGFFHTLFPVLFAGTLVYFITDKWTYVFAVFIGYTSHIFLDALTKKGIALVSEDRRSEGLILQHSIKENFMLPNLGHFIKGIFINDERGVVVTKEYTEKLAIKTAGVNQLVKFLSGGNQQKVVIGKWLARKPRILILDEPTVGVDVGVKAEIMQIIRKLANSGIAVLLISSELIELLSVCNRIFILYKGKINAELKGSEIKSEEVLHHAIQGI